MACFWAGMSQAWALRHVWRLSGALQQVHRGRDIVTSSIPIQFNLSQRHITWPCLAPSPVLWNTLDNSWLYCYPGLPLKLMCKKLRTREQYVSLVYQVVQSMICTSSVTDVYHIKFQNSSQSTPKSNSAVFNPVFFDFMGFIEHKKKMLTAWLKTLAFTKTTKWWKVEISQFIFKLD